MKLFLDTSALAKRYIQEPGSEELEELFLSSASDVIVSTLALPEFAAALGRKMRDREIGKSAATKAMIELEQDWNNLFIKIPITDSVALAAASLAIKYPLKGVDAVHLAAAIAAGVSLFVASDQQLIKICTKLDIRSYDPSAGKWKEKRNSRE